MIEITFPDGSKKEYPEGVTPYEVARSISEGLARNVISASADGKTIEVTTPLTANTSLVLYTWDDEAGKRAFWHSSAHVLAQAILRFYPDAKPSVRRSKTAFITTSISVRRNLPRPISRR